MRLVESTDHPKIVYEHARIFLEGSRSYKDKIELLKGKDAIYIQGDNEDLVTGFALLVRGMRHSVYMYEEMK